MGRRSKPQTVAEMASLGGKASMGKRSSEERREFARQGGIAGSKARAKNLTKKQRSDIARKAARARWDKK